MLCNSTDKKLSHIGNNVTTFYKPFFSSIDDLLEKGVHKNGMSVTIIFLSIYITDMFNIDYICFANSVSLNKENK